MTETAQTSIATRPVWLMGFLVGGLGANIFAIITVNYWIYHARAVFIASHPGYVAVQPPTISRAISDPAIGAPFAFWITLSAVMLVFGIGALVLVYLHIARMLSLPCNRAMLVVGSIGVVASQFAASLGMYLLSNFRFPYDIQMHMVGSYIFFVAETLVIAFGLLISATLLSGSIAADRLEMSGLIRRRAIAVRTWSGCLALGLAVSYMLIFQIKGLDFGTANTVVYGTYVLLEPMVITGFLLFLGLFQFDLWAVIRNGRQS